MSSDLLYFFFPNTDKAHSQQHRRLDHRLVITFFLNKKKRQNDPMLATSAYFVKELLPVKKKAMQRKGITQPMCYRYTEANWKYTLLHQLKEQKRKRLCGNN
jgi:hypothetical protein